jgi:hypothetical protein
MLEQSFKKLDSIGRHITLLGNTSTAYEVNPSPQKHQHEGFSEFLYKTIILLESLYKSS